MVSLNKQSSISGHGLSLIPSISGSGLSDNGFYNGIPSLIVDIAQNGLPAGTFTRPDAATVHMLRDSSGQLTLYAANTGSTDYTIGGTSLGYAGSEARTNYCTNYNTITSGITGWSVTGDVVATEVADTTALTTFKVRNVCTGNVIQLASGVLGGTAIISGQIGATGATSCRIAARVTSGTSASFGITPTPSFTTITGSAYDDFLAPNMTATATTDQFTITLPPNTTILVTLNQMERGADCSYLIKVAGSTGTRAKAFFQSTTLLALAGFNKSEGAIIVSFTPRQANAQSTTQALYVAAETGTFPQNAYYAQINSTSGKCSAWGKGGNVGYNIAPYDGMIAYRKNSFGNSWANGSEVLGVMTCGPHGTVSMATPATGTFNTFTLGAFANNSGQFNGWIDKIYFFPRRPTMNQMAPYMLGPKVGFTERGIAAAGQSNEANEGGTPGNLTNDGQVARTAAYDSLVGTSTRNHWVNGAIGGTSMHTWDPTDPNFAHTSLQYWQRVIDFCIIGGMTFDHIEWDQGEADIGNSVTILKTARYNINSYLKNYIESRGAGTNLNVIVTMLGKYHFPASYNDSTNTNAGFLKQADRELSQTYSWYKIGPEKFVNPLIDAIVHLTAAGYAAVGINRTRKGLKEAGVSVSGAVDGPTWTASVVGTTVTIILTHDIGGTDFTPTTGIEGFSLLDNGTRINITGGCARVNGTTITGTLDSLPSGGAGTQYIEYANGLLWSETVTNLVRDNTTYQLPLKSGKYLVN